MAAGGGGGASGSGGSDNVKKFGKYFLLDMVAQGGMAEIYRARTATPDGGGRLLAIKRIIHSYSQNPEFVTMFKSEIKTTSGFAHPNIVQLYDFGEEQNMLYIAMEYVDGKNLRQFMGRLSESKTVFPVEVSAYILEQAALGMYYAHSYKDRFSGKSLNIVHRDISPQNLLISYDGAVKVIDFGIAKAVTNAESTRAGVIKGKPSYLSPEQISGETLDGRSDIFALGAVLWELLTGRKLFASDNDYGVLKLIENCSAHVKPPSMYNAKVPKELDAIVLKCLQKNRDHRFANAEEMQRALHKFLYQFFPDFNPADLAYYARDFFKNDIVEDRKRLLKLNEKVEQLLEAVESAASTKITSSLGLEDTEAEATQVVSEEEDQTRLPSSRKPAPDKKSGMTNSHRMIELKADKGKTNLALDYGPSGKPARFASQVGIANQTRTGTNPMLRPPAGVGEPQAKSKSSLAAAVALLLIGGGYFYLSNDDGKPPVQEQRGVAAASPALHLTGNVKAATITIDGKTVGSAFPADIKGMPVDQPFKLSVAANGYKRFTQELTLSASEKKSLVINLVREDGAGEPVVNSQQAPGRTVPVRLNINPPGLGTVSRLNGSVIDVAGMTNAQTGVPLELIVEREGFRTARRSFTINGDSVPEGKEYVVDINLEAARFGYVSIKTTPSAEAILMIDGAEEKWSTPVSRKRIPVGTYKVKLVNSLLGMEKETTFTVSEDRFTNIEERLTVTEDSGRMPGSK